MESQRIGHDWATFTSFHFTSIRIYIHLKLQNILETTRVVARMYNNVLNVYFTPSLTLASSAINEIMCPPPEETLKGFEFIFVYGNKSQVQVWCMIQDPWGWCTGMTQRDGTGREVDREFRLGNTCTCWCMAKPIQYCKVISLQLK